MRQQHCKWCRPPSSLERILPGILYELWCTQNKQTSRVATPGRTHYTGSSCHGHEDNHACMCTGCQESCLQQRSMCEHAHDLKTLYPLPMPNDTLVKLAQLCMHTASLSFMLPSSFRGAWRVCTFRCLTRRVRPLKVRTCLFMSFTLFLLLCFFCFFFLSSICSLRSG